MAKLTEGMIRHLNSALKDYKVGFHYVLTKEPYTPTAHITVNDSQFSTVKWVDSSIVNCTNEFYKWLEKFFKENYNITLCYNNTKSTIWSDDFS